MLTYDKLREFLRNSGIISHMDYERTFNDVNWTDIWLNKVDRIVNPDSKYILFVNPDIDKETTILYHPNLQTIFYAINERMIKNNSVSGYDEKRHRVHVHYEGNGIIRIGNKSKDPLIFQFETPSIEDLIKKKNYLYYLNTLTSDIRHNEIQGLLISLGLSMGFKVKVAINDRKTQDNKAIVQETATLTIEDLNIDNLFEGISKKRIDRIDIIWFDSKKGKITAAFEVEFSGGYDGVYNRLGELNKYCSEYISSIYSIVVGESNDYCTAHAYSKMEVVKQNFLYNKLCYLSLESLAEMLSLKDNLGFGQHINTQRDVFFNKKLLQMNKELNMLN